MAIVRPQMNGQAKFASNQILNGLKKKLDDRNGL